MELCGEKGVFGNGAFYQKEPQCVVYGIGIEEHDHEGRVITAEFENYYVVTVYTPNSQRELTRLEYRCRWEADFLAYLKKLEEKKPVIFSEYLNVAHKEIDLKNPRPTAAMPDLRTRRGTALPDCWKAALLIPSAIFSDPDQEEIHSWWSICFRREAKMQAGASIILLTSKALEEGLQYAKIHHGDNGLRPLSGEDYFEGLIRIAGKD